MHSHMEVFALHTGDGHLNGVAAIILLHISCIEFFMTVIPTRLELATFCSGGRRSIH